MVDVKKYPMLWNHEMNMGHTYTILVPKKRGAGWLKTPIGHHNNALSSFISDEYGSVDCDGIEGYLAIHTIEDIDLEPLRVFVGADEIIKVGFNEFMNYVITMTYTK